MFSAVAEFDAQRGHIHDTDRDIDHDIDHDTDRATSDTACETPAPPSGIELLTLLAQASNDNARRS